jgi:RNA polymerase sigma-70 factor (ECF subfamily)
MRIDSTGPTDNDPPWKAWFHTHGPRLLLFARQQTRSRADAEDVVQEAVLKLWKRGASHSPPEPGAAFVAVRRAAIDLARRNTRRAAREEATFERDQPPTAWFENTIENTERRVAIESALRTLPMSQREVIILKIWGELTFSEIGTTLSIPQFTAASRYRYALTRLKDALAPILT